MGRRSLLLWKFRTKIFVLIIWIFLFYGLSRCQIRSSTGSMSRYTNITVFTVKKEPLNENTVLKCLNVQEIISRVRGFAWNLDDFSRRYWKANIRKFHRGVHTEIYGVFKVKNRKKFQSGSAKCNWTWKSLTRRTDAKWLYPTNLDANKNTLTGLSLALFWLGESLQMQRTFNIFIYPPIP